MKLKQLVLSVALLVVVGCAPIEPARVENGLYINPSYHFSFRVPDGWELSEKVPGSIEKNLSLVTNRKIKATFSNFNNKSFFLVSAETTEADWVTFKMYSDDFIDVFEKIYAKELKKSLKESEIKNYRYEIYQDKIEKCDKSCIAAKLDFDADDLKVTGYNIIYDHSGMVYTVTLILIARSKHHENSLMVFKRAVDSFQRL